MMYHIAVPGFFVVKDASTNRKASSACLLLSCVNQQDAAPNQS